MYKDFPLLGEKQNVVPCSWCTCLFVMASVPVSTSLFFASTHFLCFFNFTIAAYSIWRVDAVGARTYKWKKDLHKPKHLFILFAIRPFLKTFIYPEWVFSTNGVFPETNMHTWKLDQYNKASQHQFGVKVPHSFLCIVSFAKSKAPVSSPNLLKLALENKHARQFARK